MLKGLMMQEPLLVKSIAEFGERQYPDVEIVSVCRDNPLHRQTFADTFQRARKLASALTTRAGAGDRIGILAWNDYRHLESCYAVSCSGMICHTLNPALSTNQLAWAINDAEDRYLLVDPDFIPMVEAILPECPSVRGIVILSDAEHMPATSIDAIFCYESLIMEGADTFTWPLLDEETPCVLCETSASTDRQDAVLYTHRSLVLQAYASAMSEAISLSRRDCVLPTVPMFCMHSWGIPYAAAISGSKLVLPGVKADDPQLLHSLMNWEGVTVATGSEPVWLRLLNYLETHEDELGTLDRLVIDGTDCPPVLVDAYQKKFGIYVHHAWGATEPGCSLLFNAPMQRPALLPA